MRHSSIGLTMNVYTDPWMLDTRKALDVLPSMPIHDPTGERCGDPEPKHVPKHVPRSEKPPKAMTLGETGAFSDPCDKGHTEDSPKAEKEEITGSRESKNKSGRHWIRTLPENHGKRKESDFRRRRIRRSWRTRSLPRPRFTVARRPVGRPAQTTQGRHRGYDPGG